MTSTAGARRTVDLNADLGEGFGVWRLGDDEALLGIVTSANVACGFHGGDPAIMRRTCERAVERGVRIGAQVSYRDLTGFGRRRIEVEPDELAADVLYQLGALDGLARAAGDRVRYVKPHGALYNTVVDDEVQAEALVDAVLAFDRTLPLMCLHHSALLRIAAAAGLPIVEEAFADRAYTPDATLVRRSEPGAVVHDPRTVAERAVRMAVEGSVTAVDGTTISVTSRSICVHGDTPGAVAIAAEVRRALAASGVVIRAFT